MMQNFTIKKFESIILIILSLLSLIYIGLLLGIIEIHYNALSSIHSTSIYDAVSQYNWKYWFEESNNYQTVFAIFLQFLDMNYLYSKGILPIVVNISFIFFLTALISIIIRNIFPSKENHTTLIQGILIFSTIIILFSAMQDSSIVWMFNQQLFAAYFFPLLSYYLLMKFSITKNNRYFYALLLSGMMIVISTPYYFSALIVLLLMGYIFKIGWLKNLLISTLIILSFFLYYNDISNSTAIASLLNADMAYKNFLYILNYLGSLFVYVSFEPCFATSSIFGGIFILGTFIYFSYLAVTKKVTDQLYWVILAFLFFYILTAFGSLTEINNSNIVIFKNQYMTPSLIAWSLILILYIHHFHTIQVIQRRILTISLTLIVILFFYQIFTYQQYKKDISKLKLEAIALKLGIDDKRCMSNITNSVYIMMYSPHKESKKQMSMFTITDIKAKAIQNKANLLKEKNPFYFRNEDTKNILEESKPDSIRSDQALQGALDKAMQTDKNNNIIKILGWVYDAKEKKVPNWLMVLDENSNIIGYIITGVSRKDVEMKYGKDAAGSGFIGYIRYSKTPTTLFMVDESEKKILEVKYSIE